MPQTLVCPHCTQPLGVEERFLGTEVACPHCGQAFIASPPPASPEMRMFGCPSCGQAFQVAWPAQTARVACPSCQMTVRLSDEPQEAAAMERLPRIITHPPAAEADTEKLLGEAIELPTEDGGTVTVHESVKTIRKGSRTVVLRKLSPEEKQRRRTIQNIVFFVVGALLLALTVAVLRQIAA